MNGIRLGCLGLIFAVSFSSEGRAELTENLRRGYDAGVQCTSVSKVPSGWCITFRNLIIAKSKTENAAFMLGAYFGFSFMSEESAEKMAANERELARAARCALSARVTYESIKHKLGLRDVEIIQILHINRSRFLAWKARAETNDPDFSVRKEIDL